MNIGKVIRKYRKEKQMTQEEMAQCLGVSAPAVNKWERQNTYPDITLLAPIARLLGISVDELLSYQVDLSEKEIEKYLEELQQMLGQDKFSEACSWARKKIQEFPNCYELMMDIMATLDADRLFHDRIVPEDFEKYLESVYQRVLESEKEEIRLTVVEALMAYYTRQERYEEAEKYLEYYSPQNPERKQKQAQLYYENGEDEKAYKAYEEILFSEYQRISVSMHGIYLLAMKENNFEKAHIMAKKQAELAKVFEMGKYYEVSPYLELAIVEKDEKAVIRIAKDMLESIEQIEDFREASLYAHMEFRKREPSIINELHENLRNTFRDEETYGFMKGKEEWENLINGEMCFG